MGAVVSIAAVIADGTAERSTNAPETELADVVGAGRVCLSTGIFMLLSAVVAWSI